MGKKKVLFLNYHLQLGGGEKLLLELCKFTLDQGAVPYVLVPTGKKEEFYDQEFTNLGIKILRIEIKDYAELFREKKWRELKWNLIIKKFGNLFFSSYHIINLSVFEEWSAKIQHKNRNIWHITNLIQMRNYTNTYSSSIFQNPNDTLIYQNTFQAEELRRQYTIACKEVYFKLFLYDQIY